MRRNNHSTPILAAVRAMHDEQDGRDPYNTLRRPFVGADVTTAKQRAEASEILACYETSLTLENDK